MADAQESMRRADLFTSVTSAPLELIVYRFTSSTLDRIKHKLRGVLSRVEAPGYTENDEDVQIVSEFMDDIRDAVIDYQVSGNPKPFLRVPDPSNRLGGAPTGYI